MGKVGFSDAFLCVRVALLDGVSRYFIMIVPLYEILSVYQHTAY